MMVFHRLLKQRWRIIPLCVFVMIYLAWGQSDEAWDPCARAAPHLDVFHYTDGSNNIVWRYVSESPGIFGQADLGDILVVHSALDNMLLGISNQTGQIKWWLKNSAFEKAGRLVCRGRRVSLQLERVANSSSFLYADRFLLGVDDGHLLYDSGTGAKLVQHEGLLLSVADFSPDRVHHRVSRIDPKNGNVLWTIADGSRPSSMNIVNNKYLLVTVFSATLYDLHSGEQLWGTPIAPMNNCCCFHDWSYDKLGYNSNGGELENIESTDSAIFIKASNGICTDLLRVPVHVANQKLRL